MSDLARQETSAIDYSRMEAIAKKYGVPLENNYSDLYSDTYGNYTAFIGPKSARSIIELHKNQTWSWTEPGAGLKDAIADMLYYKVGDQIVEYGFPEEIRGICINYQQRDELRAFENNKIRNICSVIGYLQDGQHVKALPNTPYKNKYQWGKDATGKSVLVKNKPNPIVGKLGLVGNRGGQPTLCEQCIKCGKATEEVIDEEKGGTKTVECEPRGRLYFLVWEVAKIRQKKSKVKGGNSTKMTTEVSSIFDLCDAEGNKFTEPLLLSISLSKSGIQGRWNKEDPDQSIEGFDWFFQDIIRKNQSRAFMQNLLFHYTSIKLLKAENSTVYQTHFTNLGFPKEDFIEYASEYWNKHVPVPTVETLEVSETVSFEDSDSSISVQDSIEALVEASVDDILPQEYQFTPESIPTPTVEIVEEDDIDLLELEGKVGW